MASYGKKASEKVERAMHERKTGALKSGGSGKTVKSRKQAIAIGLSEARRAGIRLPPRPGAAKPSRLATPGTAKKTSAKRSRASLEALKREPTSSVSPAALSRQARDAAAKRSPAARKQAAAKAVRTKGAEGLKSAGQKAARTRKNPR